MLKEYVPILMNLILPIAIWFGISEWLLFKRLRKLEKNRGKFIGDYAFWFDIEMIVAVFYNKHKKDKEFTKYVWNVRISVIVFLLLIALVFLFAYLG